MALVKHIHEVIFLVEEHNGQLSPVELINTISEKWSEDVCFGACSGTPFPKEYALEFLLSRNKVMLSDSGKVALHPSMEICSGHETFAG